MHNASKSSPVFLEGLPSTVSDCVCDLSMPPNPALLCDSTRDELFKQLQRRGLGLTRSGTKVAANKGALKAIISMSIENEELKQELALARKKRPASPAVQSTPSKRATAGGAAEDDASPSSGSADMSRDMRAATGAPMTCSACLPSAHRCYAHLCYSLTSLQASMVPKHPKFSVAVARAPCAASASCTAAALIAMTW
jgi:hypothetical protein